MFEFEIDFFSRGHARIRRKLKQPTELSASAYAVFLQTFSRQNFCINTINLDKLRLHPRETELIT